MSEKPNVLMIASLGDPPYVGGIENVVDTLLRSELKERFDFSVFDTFRVPDPERIRLQKAHYAVRLALSCWARLRDTRPDIVHIHFCSGSDFWKHAICLSAARLHGAKTVFHLHGGAFGTFLNELTPLQRPLTRRVFRMADRVIALSSYWKEFLLQLTPSERIRIVSNPIDCEKLSPGPRELDPDYPKLLLLGRLGKSKGHYDVLKALPLVLKKHPNVRVLFAGGDDDHGATEALKRLTEERGLSSQVDFLGPVSLEPKVELLRTITVMLLPSYAENMPLSVLEAMAACVPVVATRVGAIPEMLDEGTVGILIDPGDWQALAESVIRLLDDPPYAQELGRLAGEKARRVWDVKRIGDQVAALYHELLSLEAVGLTQEARF